MNTVAFFMLFKKEILRFWKVKLQTLFSPILTAILYQLVFSHAMAEHADVYPTVSYAVFLIPGLVMMSMLQNAFANASSSLIQSRIGGNLIFILLSPISPTEFFAAYTLAAITRGFLVGIGVALATVPFGLSPPEHIGWMIFFALSACWVMAVFGLMAGVVAEKFDQLAMFQNFLIMPLTFLSGVFYSIQSLPPFWQSVSRFNPVFYMIDGFRYGFFGHSDVPVVQSALMLIIFALILSAIMLRWLHSGYRLRY